MLAPRDTPSRERRRLDGLWSFAFDHARTGRVDGWWRGPLRDAGRMPGAEQLQRHSGGQQQVTTMSATSGTSVRLPDPLRGLGGGQRVPPPASMPPPTGPPSGPYETNAPASTQAGYTPFEADVSAFVVPGRPHRLTVVVNNELTWGSILARHRRGSWRTEQASACYHDFFNYAGLHRGVWLSTTPPAHVAT